MAGVHADEEGAPNVLPSKRSNSRPASKTSQPILANLLRFKTGNMCTSRFSEIMGFHRRRTRHRTRFTNYATAVPVIDCQNGMLKIKL